MDASTAAAPLEDAVLRGDLTQVMNVLAEVPAPQRPQLGLLVGSLGRRAAGHFHAHSLALARVAVADTPEAAAQALAHPSLPSPELGVEVLNGQDLNRVAQTAQHLAEHVEDCQDPRLVVVETLCGRYGLPRPTSAPYLRALASALAGADSRFGPDLAQVLRADGDLRELVYSMLVTPEAGAAMGSGRWAQAIVTIAGEELLDRARLLDILLRSLGSGDEQQSWFLDLHVRLAPTDEEFAARADAYAGALAALTPQARVAFQRTLKQRDALAPLPVPVFVAITTAALQQPERQTALRQIRWASRLLARNPKAADEVCLALSTGLGHPQVEVRQSCLTEISRWVKAGALGHRTLDVVRERALALRPGAEAGPDGTGHTAAPQDLRQLAHAAHEYLFALDAHLGELLMDGVAALAAPDPQATREALQDVRRQMADLEPQLLGPDGGVWLGERPVLALLLCLALPDDHPVQEVAWVAPPGPPGCLTLRALEVRDQVRAGQRRRLLALPTGPTGRVDPDVLAQRLRRMAQDGTAPWPLDLEQAVLRARTPDGDGAGIGTALARVPSEAARVVEQQMHQEGPRTPVFELARVPEGSPQFPVGRRVAGRTLVHPQETETSPADGPLAEHAFDTGRLWAELCSGRTAGRALTVLMALPHHREMAAAYLTAGLAGLGHQHSQDDLAALRLIATAGGRPHTAVALCLLYAAGSANVQARATVTEALQHLSLGSDLDRTSCGRVWARVLATGQVPLSRLAGTLEPLTDDPQQAGLVWSVLEPTLPVLAEHRPPGLADLVAVAAAAAVRWEAAAPDGAPPGEIVAVLDGLSETAEEPLAMQARRLRKALTAGR